MITAAGMTTLTFCADAQVSMPTFYKFQNRGRINDRSRDKITAAIERLEARLGARAKQDAALKEPA